jgi:hypothetical protein
VPDVYTTEVKRPECEADHSPPNVEDKNAWSLASTTSLHRASWHSSATLTEVFPCFFLSCKANARVKTRKDGARPAPFQYFLCCSMYCLFCVVLCTVCV